MFPSINVGLFSFQLIFRTLLLAIPYSMWYLFAVLSMMSNILCNLFSSILDNITSSTHKRHPITSSNPVILIPRSSLAISVLVSSISSPYSNTDSAPHIMSCHAMQCHAIPCHDMHDTTCHAMSCQVIPWNAIAFHVMSHHVTHIMSHRVIPCTV